MYPYVPHVSCQLYGSTFNTVLIAEVPYPYRYVRSTVLSKQLRTMICKSYNVLTVTSRQIELTQVMVLSEVKLSTSWLRKATGTCT